jgi:predicted ATP-grasp superfamily ATP-dependent carboligase
MGTVVAVDALTIDCRPAVDRPTLLAAFSGWSDAGSAATNAVQYVAAQVGAQKFATIDGEEFFDFTVQRPLVRLDDQQLRHLQWPSYEFSAGRNIIFLVGPEPHLRWRTFCGLVERVVDEVGVERVALLGAFLAEVLYTDPVPLTGFASDPALLDRLKVSSTSYQGPTGVVGALADALRRKGLPLFSLWAAIPHYIAAAPNPRGALALLLKLREWMELSIDTAPLEAAAATFQAQLLEAVEGNAELSNYIRALKKGETSH